MAPFPYTFLILWHYIELISAELSAIARCPGARVVPDILSAALHHAVDTVSRVHPTVGELENAWSFDGAVDDVPAVGERFPLLCPRLNPLSGQRLLPGEDPRDRGAVLHDARALSGNLVVLPVSLVNSPVAPLKGAVAAELPVDELAHVLRPVGEHLRPLPVRKVLFLFDVARYVFEFALV